MTVQFNEALFKQLVACGFPVRGRFHRLPTADLLCQEIVKINPYLHIRYSQHLIGEDLPPEGMPWSASFSHDGDIQHFFAPTIGEALCKAYIFLRSPKD